MIRAVMDKVTYDYYGDDRKVLTALSSGTVVQVSESLFRHGKDY